MVAKTKIMGKFEVGHWMGAQKRFYKNEKHLPEMVAWKKIMGKFEVGHWMGAKKRGMGNAGFRNFEKGLETAFYLTKMRNKHARFDRNRI